MLLEIKYWILKTGIKQMRHRLLTLLMFAVCGYMAHAQQVLFQRLTWQEAKDKARAEGKGIFVDVYTTWCAPCKKMAKKRPRMVFSNCTRRPLTPPIFGWMLTVIFMTHSQGFTPPTSSSEYPNRLCGLSFRVNMSPTALSGSVGNGH